MGFSKFARRVDFGRDKEKWKVRIRQESKIKLPETLLDYSLDEKKGEFCVALELAKYISYTLPEYRDQAIEIYLEVLTREHIQGEIKKANKKVMTDEDVEVKN